MTNGNLSALRFYMRRGFRLNQVRFSAVDRGPQAEAVNPLLGEHGIPIHDEPCLCRVLDPGGADLVPMPPWSESRPDPIAAARQSYAEELGFTAPIRSAAVVWAFATVPREHLFGPGPWRIFSPMSPAQYWTTDHTASRHVYHDVLVAIDERRRLNNGQPSLWDRLYDQLGLTAGAHFVHVGSGTGYSALSWARLSVPLERSLRSRSTRSLPPERQKGESGCGGWVCFRLEGPANAVIVMLE